MDRRIESRFSISSPIKVTLLSSLDQRLDCRMIDISANGMRFISETPIAEDEVVAVDFDDHLAVTRVRNSLPYGEKYSIGTSRIHSLPKSQLPQGEPQWQQIRMMLEEKGWAVELGLEDGVELSSESASTESGSTAAAEAAVPADPAPIAAPAAAMQPPAVAVAEAEPVVESKAQPLEQPPIAQPVPLPPPAPRPEPLSKPANLPPIPMPAPEPPGSKRGVVLVAGAIALVILGTLYFLQTRHTATGTRPLVVDAPVKPLPPPQAAPEPAPEPAPAQTAAPPPVAKAPAVKTSIQPPKPAPAPTKPIPPPAAVAATPAASGPAHSVRVTVQQPCWITATADGKTVFAKVIEPGSQDFSFTKFAFVHIGNSRSTEISLDGTAVPVAPGTGALRLVQLTASGARNIPWSNGDPAAPR